MWIFVNGSKCLNINKDMIFYVEKIYWVLSRINNNKFIFGYILVKLYIIKEKLLRVKGKILRK